MKRIAAMVTLVLLGGAAQAQPAEPGAGCAASAALSWVPVAGKAYRVGATAAGRTCAGAVVTLTIRGPAGPPLLGFTSAAADLPLGATGSAAAMAAALRRWIEQPATGRTTRDLPGWDAGAVEPAANGAIFRTEPEITRASYAELRKAGQPLFCFAQGMGREACYALEARNDRLILIGTWGAAG